LNPSALLNLIWLASPALPVGGFSYSEGLEAAVEAGEVRDEATAQHWLIDHLHLVQARAEWPVTAAAHTAWLAHDEPRIHELNNWVHTTRESAEMRRQTEQMGRSLNAWLHNGAQAADPRCRQLAELQPAPTWPVAFALAAALADVPAEPALLAHAFGWAENMVQAAIKAVPLGQSAGQRLLAALADAIPDAVSAAIAMNDDDRQAFAPMFAIRSAQHETQYSRLFRS
jgi:urease accessory protein